MRGKTIARALEGLATDPEMLRSLFQLNDTLGAVLSDGVATCEHCGRTQPVINRRAVALLAERLLTVVEDLQVRMDQSAADHPGPSRASGESRRRWSRNRPDLPPGARHSKSRGRLGEGNR